MIDVKKRCGWEYVTLKPFKNWKTIRNIIEHDKSIHHVSSKQNSVTVCSLCFLCYNFVMLLPINFRVCDW